MQKAARRSYHSPRRAEQAQETRSAILASARRLFSAHGYAQVTIHTIAEASGVSPQTVYFAFGSKAAILSALMRSVGMGPRSQALGAQMRAESDPRAKLRLLAALLRSMREDDADVVALLWEAGSDDPDLVKGWREVNATRWERVSEIAASLEAQGALKRGVTAAAAADHLWVISSPEVWRLLVKERGWSMKRWEEWLTSTLTTLLLREDGPARARRPRPSRATTRPPSRSRSADPDASRRR